MKIDKSEWGKVPKTKVFGGKRYTHYVSGEGTPAKKKVLMKAAKREKARDKTLLARVVKVGNLYCIYTAKKQG